MQCVYDVQADCVWSEMVRGKGGGDESRGYTTNPVTLEQDEVGLIPAKQTGDMLSVIC